VTSAPSQLTVEPVANGSHAISANGSNEESKPAAPGARSSTWALVRETHLIEIAIAQSTVVTALFFYYGWAQASANLGHFGVDVSILQLSVTDYLLRSVPVAVVPFFNAAMYATVAVTILYLLIRLTPRQLVSVLTSRYAILCLIPILVLLMTWSILYHHRRATLPAYPPETPLFPVVVSALLVLALRRWQRLDPRPANRLQTALERLVMGAAVALTILGLFWYTGLIAGQVGEDRARTAVAGPR